jgi:23S rRNA pseudouridine1911/1915/1917 synthase
MQISISFIIPEAIHGQRLDQAVSTLGADYSRSQWQDWIKSGQVHVNGEVVTKPRYKVSTGEQIDAEVEPAEQGEWIPQDIPLDIIYEDEQLIIVNKPAGLVVHPGAGNPDRTLVNALRFYDPELVHIPRAGIIHRLDKDTTGLLIVARTLDAHHALTQALSERLIKREYQAIVHGHLISGGTINAAIDRHTKHRTKMAIREHGRDATTHYRLLQKFNHFTHIRCELETGRTHQIRVHMTHIDHPLVGDKLYGYGNSIPGKMSDAIRALAREFPRQALHAWRLTLTQPKTGETIEVEAPLPADMCNLLLALEQQNA